MGPEIATMLKHIFFFKKMIYGKGTKQVVERNLLCAKEGEEVKLSLLEIVF